MTKLGAHRCERVKARAKDLSFLVGARTMSSPFDSGAGPYADRRSSCGCLKSAPLDMIGGSANWDAALGCIEMDR
jgi:hypothetical protein